jgi:UMF1 family MFS transporter
MEDGQISNLIAFSLIFSVLAAFGAGRVSDKIGPKITLLATMGVWVVGIMALVFAWAPWVLFVAAPLLFLATGATIALGPVLLIALSPSESLTEFMGFYVTVGMVSSALGPVIIGLLLGMFGGLGAGAYRIAISSIAVAMVVGIFLLLRVPDARTSDAGPWDFKGKRERSRRSIRQRIEPTSHQTEPGRAERDAIRGFGKVESIAGQPAVGERGHL